MKYWIIFFLGIFGLLSDPRIMTWEDLVPKFGCYIVTFSKANEGSWKSQVPGAMNLSPMSEADTKLVIYRIRLYVWAN